jgi:hypothetical protein
VVHVPFVDIMRHSSSPIGFVLFFSLSFDTLSIEISDERCVQAHLPLDGHLEDTNEGRDDISSMHMQNQTPERNVNGVVLFNRLNNDAKR